MSHLAIEAGSRWEITTKYGVYTVDVNEFSDYKGGAVSGPYSCYGNYQGVGCFPFADITKMVKI